MKEKTPILKWLILIAIFVLTFKDPMRANGDYETLLDLKYSCEKENQSCTRYSSYRHNLNCSQLNITDCVTVGKVEEDPLAGPYFKLACDKGNLEGCIELADWARKIERIIVKRKEECKEGTKEACVDLFVFANTTDESTKAELAEELYQKACNGGNLTGCRKIAHMKDEEGKHAEAKQMLKKVCEAGDFRSCYEIHIINYEENSKVARDKNEAEAKQLLTKACQKRKPEGCFWLGVLAGAKHTEAKKFYKQSCDLGFLEGCAAAAVIEALAKNIYKARIFWNKACDKGHKTSCFNLVKFQ